MKHFTISAKGRRTHTFKESGFMYSLETMNDEGRIEEYFIYADSRKAACEKGEIIVSAQDMNAEVKRQNGLQQLHRAELLRGTGEYTDQQINDFIERIKAHHGLNDITEVNESNVKAEAEKQETKEDKHMSISPYKVFQSFKIVINDVTYDVDMKRVKDKNYHGETYECTVYLFNNEEETVRTIDNFKLVYNLNDRYFWAWTGNLMAGVHIEKINIRETIAKTLNKQVEEKSTSKNETAKQTNTYTTYNRSFPSYAEAEAYCIESDFDPSYITAEEPIKASQNALQLDLQLFSTSTVEEEIKPFKQPYATYKNGVSKFGIGKHLELVYTLETTKENATLDDMYYSNIHKYEFDNLQDVLERFNLYQQLGYHNMQLWTEIRYKGNTVIENGTSNELEFLVNDSRLKQAHKTEEENQSLRDRIHLYETFIKQYKSEELFNHYKKNHSNL